MPIQSDHLSVGEFRSTNPDAFVNSLIAFTSKLKEHQLSTLDIQGKKFEGMLDYSAELSVIFLQQWLENWLFQDI